jgi:predicted secreted hydrolase
VFESGPNQCDTAYSNSFVRLYVKGKINDKNVYGLGYGEHVYGTFNNSTKKYSGWHCHYLHFFDYKDMFVCQSNLYDKKRDIYARSLIIDSNDNRHWLSYEDFEFIKLNYWKSNKTNITYPIEWKLNIFDQKINQTLIPYRNNQETNLLFLNFWDGIIHSENAIGFTELFGYI